MTAERIETLFYAVCWRVLFKYFGMLGVVLAALYSGPLAVAVLFSELEVPGATSWCWSRCRRQLARWLVRGGLRHLHHGA